MHPVLSYLSPICRSVYLSESVLSCLSVSAVEKTLNVFIEDTSQAGRVKEIGKMFEGGNPIFPKHQHHKDTSNPGILHKQWIVSNESSCGYIKHIVKIF